MHRYKVSYAGSFAVWVGGPSDHDSLVQDLPCTLNWGYMESESLGDYLNPKSMQNNSPKPIITAIKAIILHTFGVQVQSCFEKGPGMLLFRPRFAANLLERRQLRETNYNRWRHAQQLAKVLPRLARGSWSSRTSTASRLHTRKQSPPRRLAKSFSFL